MKANINIVYLFFVTFVANAQSDKAIFLHHSTGGAVFSEGNVTQWISDYNTQHATNYSVTELAYPNDPWGWENYPYDFWKLWVDGSCDNAVNNIQCFDRLCQDNELIIFKHCFPGAGISEDSGNGNVASAEKTLANYQLQYRALLALFDQYPNNKIMVWTLAPLHRNATDTGQTARAAQFANWVKNIWLTEDGKNHPNVFIFDFFGLAAEQAASPANGMQYCLKYDYEGDHNGSDSHPNTSANQLIGPIFAEQIVTTLATTTIVTENIPSTLSLELLSDASSKTLSYKIIGQTAKTPFRIEVFSVLGQPIKIVETFDNSGLITLNRGGGIYIVQVNINGTFISQKVIL